MLAGRTNSTERLSIFKRTVVAGGNIKACRAIPMVFACLAKGLFFLLDSYAKRHCTALYTDTSDQEDPNQGVRQPTYLIRNKVCIKVMSIIIFSIRGPFFSTGARCGYLGLQLYLASVCRNLWVGHLGRGYRLEA